MTCQRSVQEGHSGGHCSTASVCLSVSLSVSPLSFPILPSLSPFLPDTLGTPTPHHHMLYCQPRAETLAPVIERDRSGDYSENPERTRVVLIVFSSTSQKLTGVLSTRAFLFGASQHFPSTTLPSNPLHFTYMLKHRIFFTSIPLNKIKAVRRKWRCRSTLSE